MMANHPNRSRRVKTLSFRIVGQGQVVLADPEATGENIEAASERLAPARLAGCWRCR